MFGKQRYNSNPIRFWESFPPRSYTLWTGERHFYVNSHYQAQAKEGQIVGYPGYSWETWKYQFNKASGYAFNPASGLRFSFYHQPDPYAFAVEATVAELRQGDTIVNTIGELENWMVSLGLNPDDRMSAPAMGLVLRLIALPINFLMRNAGFASFTLDEWRDWRAWGGATPNK